MVRKRYRIALFLVSIFILSTIVLYSKPQQLVGIISQADIFYIFLGFVISTICAIFRVYKWKVMLEKPSFRELFPVQIFGITMSSFTPGKIAEPFKCLILKMTTGISVAKTLPSVIWERINDLIVLILLSTIALHFLGGKLLILGYISIAAFSVLIIILLTILYSRMVRNKIFSFIKKLPILNKISDEFIQTFHGSGIEKKRIFMSFIITIVPWILEGFILYFALMALGIQLSPIILAGVVAIATIIGVVSFLPGGIGSSEAVMIILLGMMGVDGTVAVAGVLLARFMSLWYGMFLGGLSFIYLSKKIDLKNIFDMN